MGRRDTHLAPPAKGFDGDVEVLRELPLTEKGGFDLSAFDRHYFEIDSFLSV